MVGYSGGLDSHTLLHWLATQRPLLRQRGVTLRAVYLDHGLQPHGERWRAHCAAVCDALDVDFAGRRIDAAAARGESPEAAARAARYRAFGDELESDGAALLTAHHGDDQAETVLLALLRGSGPAGLAAMPECAPLGRGRLLRPLLDCSRQTLRVYAERHALRWIDDDSNAELRYDRNYLRHAVMPALRRRWPAAGRGLAHSARLAAEAAALLDRAADDELARRGWRRGEPLSLRRLDDLDAPARRNLLRRWLRRQYPRRPPLGRVQLEQLQRCVIAAAADRQPRLDVAGIELRRYRDRLYALPPPPPPPPRLLDWPDRRRPLSIAPFGTLSLRRAAPGRDGLCAAGLDDVALRVGFRAAAAAAGLPLALRPAGQPHRRSVKRLLYDAGIPPWQRERLPLLYAGDRLLAVADRWTEAAAGAAPGEPGLVLTWQKPPHSDNV